MTKTNPKSNFKGFYSPRATQVPDNFFDEALPELSGAEVKVLLYVFRRTFGFKKDADNISLSQLVSGITTKDGRTLDRGTGLSKASVTRAVTKLVERGMLLKRRRRSKRRGFEATTYTPALAAEPPEQRRATLTPLSQNKTRGGLKSKQGLVSKLNIQVKHTQLNKTVNGDQKPSGSLLRQLPDLKQPSDQTGLIAQEILDAYGDGHSKRHYQLVAAKIPYTIINKAISEIKNDGGANHPERVFTKRMEGYALRQLKRQLGST